MFSKLQILYLAIFCTWIASAKAQNVKADSGHIEIVYKRFTRDSFDYKKIHLLTDTERNAISVTVDDQKIGAPFDKVYVDRNGRERKGKFIRIPVITHNKAVDTLKYFSMTCSWYEIYHINNNIVGVNEFACQYNTICEIKIPPNGSYSKELTVICRRHHVNKKEKFKVGVSINKSKYIQEDDAFVHFEFLSRYNIVWSNEVQLKNN